MGMGADNDVMGNGESVANGPGHQGSRVSCVVFSFNSQVIASAQTMELCFWGRNTSVRRCGCGDGTIAIWNPEMSGVGQCCVVNFDSGPFRTMRINVSHPNILLTEYCAWKFDITEAKADMPVPVSRFRPEALPFGISRGGEWITWNEKT